MTPAPTSLQLLVLALSWVSYFALHSLLIAPKTKHWIARRFPRIMPAYRLLFNLQAVVLLVALIILSVHWKGPKLWHFDGVVAWLITSLNLAALAGFVGTTRAYDGAEFWGLRQWREKRTRGGEGERLVISTVHRYVRHPWYFFGLILLWTREMDATLLVGSGLATLYLWIGSRWEEIRLVRRYGTAYRDYQQRVPGLVPWPGKVLSAEEAHQLETLAQEEIIKGRKHHGQSG